MPDLCIYSCRYLVSMAPLCYELPRAEGSMPPHFGPAVPEVNSVWFKLFIYQLSQCGPPSLLLPRGTRLRRLPPVFMEYEKFLVFSWGHEATVVPLTNIFFTINEALMHSPVFIQVRLSFNLKTLYSTKNNLNARIFITDAELVELLWLKVIKVWHDY